MPVPAHAMLMAGGGAASFDPVTAVGWSHAWYVGGSEFAALGLSSGNAVSTWPDELGAYDLTQATGSAQPAYQATGGPNSKPAVVHDSGDWMQQATVSIATPWTVVIIASTPVGTGVRGDMFVAQNDTGSEFPTMVWKSTADKFDSFIQASLTAPPNSDTNPHLFTVYNPAAGDRVMELDGTGYTGANRSITLTSLTLSATVLGATTGQVTTPFFATYDGDARTDGGWASFEAWVSSHYGITIA